MRPLTDKEKQQRAEVDKRLAGRTPPTNWRGIDMGIPHLDERPYCPTPDCNTRLAWEESGWFCPKCDNAE